MAHELEAGLGGVTDYHAIDIHGRRRIDSTYLHETTRSVRCVFRAKDNGFSLGKRYRVEVLHVVSPE